MNGKKELVKWKVIWTFSFRTIHAGLILNFTGTNLSKNRNESKIPNGSMYFTQLSIFKKLGNMSDMQNNTTEITYKSQNSKLYYTNER